MPTGTFVISIVCKLVEILAHNVNYKNSSPLPKANVLMFRIKRIVISLEYLEDCKNSNSTQLNKYILTYNLPF